MSEAHQIKTALDRFILENFLFGDESRLPSGGESLIGKGILDSTGILELIDHLEKTYGITIEEHETVPENLDSIDTIIRFVERKTAVA